MLLRGAEGFGRLHHLRTDRLLSLSEDLPVVSIAVDRRERIEAMLEPLLQIKRRGLVTLERTRLLSGEIGPVRLPEQLQEATKLTIYVGRRERANGTPAFAAVCELLHRRGVAGATVLLGVDGTRGGRRLRARLLQPQRRRPDGDRRGRLGRADRRGAARARAPAERAAADAGARARVQARRASCSPPPTSCPRATSVGLSCGRS